MTRNQVADIIAYIARLFPKTSWEPEVQAEVARRCAALPIDGEQAKAALTNLAMGHKYKSVDPGEALRALQGAVSHARSGPDLAGTPTSRKRSVETLLDRAPSVFWSLAERACNECGAPRHFFDARQGFWEWGPSRDFIYERMPAAYRVE